MGASEVKSQTWRERFEEAEQERRELTHLVSAIRSGTVDSVRSDAGVLRLLDAQLVEENARLMTELARSNEELQRFSYAVAHDFKAPLRNIVFLTEVLKEDLVGKNDDGCFESMDRIETACGRLSSLFDALLAYAKVDGGQLKYERFDLRDLCLEVIEMFKVQDDTVDIDVSALDLAPVQADRGQLMLVIQNIVENSYKYRDVEKERLKLSIAGGFGRPIPNAENSKGRTVRISISDNGIGFDVKYAHQMFEPFRRLVASDQGEGSGIGLATVSRILKRHGGRIEAVGELGVGATFEMILPAADEH